MKHGVEGSIGAGVSMLVGEIPMNGQQAVRGASSKGPDQLTGRGFDFEPVIAVGLWQPGSKIRAVSGLVMS